MANKEKLLAFTVKIKAKQSNKEHSRILYVFMLGLKPTPYFPKVKKCGRNERKGRSETF